MNKTELIQLPYLPKLLDELKAMANNQSPFEVAALAVAAFCNYENDPQETVRMVNFLKGPQPLSVMDEQFIRDRLKGKGYVVRSYIRGTSPANDYTVPAGPITIEVSDNPYSYTNEGYATLWLHSSGADSPRQVTLRKKTSTGEWFLWQHTFLSDIRPPVSADPWA